MFSGFVQIPVSTEHKKALIEWEEIYKGIKPAPTLTEIKKKFKKFRMANLCGKINNIIILDIDKPKMKLDKEGNPTILNDGLKHFKQLMKDNDKTLTFKSPSGGRHYYFKYDDEIKSSLLGINGYSIDVLNNGKYGILYDILIDAPIQPMPENIKEFVMKDYNNKKEKKKKASNRISNKQKRMK